MADGIPVHARRIPVDAGRRGPREATPGAGPRVLLVTPMTTSSGEAITAATVARSVQAHGGTACFLASAFAWEFVSRIVEADVLELTADAEQNSRQWDAALSTWRPDVVLFAAVRNAVTTREYLVALRT